MKDVNMLRTSRILWQIRRHKNQLKHSVENLVPTGINAALTMHD